MAPEDKIRQFDLELESIDAEISALNSRRKLVLSKRGGLELEANGTFTVNLSEINTEGEPPFADFNDFILRTGPYLPSRGWAISNDPSTAKAQRLGRLKGVSQWEKDLGVPGAFEFVLDALVAAFHPDPTGGHQTSIKNDSGSRDNRLLRVHTSRRVFQDPVTNEMTMLHLPSPAEVKGKRWYYPLVRAMIVDRLVIHHAAKQEYEFIESIKGIGELSELTGIEFLHQISTSFCNTNRDGELIDLSKNALRKLIEELIQHPQIASKLLPKEVETYVHRAVNQFQASCKTPPLVEIKKQVVEVAYTPRLRRLLDKSYRTTEDRFRRHT